MDDGNYDADAPVAPSVPKAAARKGRPDNKAWSSSDESGEAWEASSAETLKF